MIGAASQHDAMGARLFHPSQRLSALATHIPLESLILGPGSIHCIIYLGLSEMAAHLHDGILVGPRELLVQALLELLLVVVGKPGAHEGGGTVLQLIYIQPQSLRIAGHDGAVEVVPRRLIFLALPLATGHPDEIRLFLQQVHDVPMGELRRITDAL